MIYWMRVIYCILFFFLTQLLFSQNVDSLYQVVRNQKNDSIKIDALYKLSNIFLSSNLTEANKLNRQSFTLSKRKYLDFGLAKSFNIKGIIFDINGKSDSALYCYQKAIYHSKKAKLFATQASAFNNIGLLEWNKANYLNALKYYNLGLQIFEKINDKKGQANTQSNIGLIYQSLNDKINAEKYFFQSLKLREEIHDYYGISVSYTNLGRFHEDANENEKAIFYYEKAISNKRKINDLRGIAITLNNLSSLQYNERKIAEAYSSCLEAIQIGEQLEAPSILAYAYLGLTDIYRAKKDIVKAKEANELAKKYCIETEDQAGLKNYYYGEIQLALLQNDFKAAYLNQVSKDSLQNVIIGLEVQKAVSEIETKYQVEKKEKDLARAKVKVAERELEIKQKNTQLYLSIGASVTFLLIGFLFYNQQKLKNTQLIKENELKEALVKIETQNKLQEQRLQISRDLHDNIGSQLTFIISSIDNLKYFDIAKEKLVTKFDDISGFTQNTITELRDTIWAMNKNEITLEDLQIRIINFIEKAKVATHGIAFEFSIDKKCPSNLKFSSVEGMNIYRIIQETLNNSIKHSGCTSIKIQIYIANNTLIIEISDNGKGFLLNEIIEGNGLSNCRKRAQELGAEIDFITLEKGSLVKLSLNHFNS